MHVPTPLLEGVLVAGVMCYCWLLVKREVQFTGNIWNSSHIYLAILTRGVTFYADTRAYKVRVDYREAGWTRKTLSFMQHFPRFNLPFSFPFEKKRKRKRNLIGSDRPSPASLLCFPLPLPSPSPSVNPSSHGNQGAADTSINITSRVFVLVAASVVSLAKHNTLSRQPVISRRQFWHRFIAVRYEQVWVTRCYAWGDEIMLPWVFWCYWKSKEWYGW